MSRSMLSGTIEGERDITQLHQLSGEHSAGQTKWFNKGNH